MDDAVDLFSAGDVQAGLGIQDVDDVGHIGQRQTGGVAVTVGSNDPESHPPGRRNGRQLEGPGS